MKHFLVLHLLDNLPWRRRRLRESALKRSQAKLKVAQAPSTTSWSPFLPEEGIVLAGYPVVVHHLRLAILSMHLKMHVGKVPL